MKPPAIAFKTRYSGLGSETFWKTVRDTENWCLYAFACSLQDMEARVLRAVLDAQMDGAEISVPLKTVNVVRRNVRPVRARAKVRSK